MVGVVTLSTGASAVLSAFETGVILGSARCACSYSCSHAAISSAIAWLAHRLDRNVLRAEPILVGGFVGPVGRRTAPLSPVVHTEHKRRLSTGNAADRLASPQDIKPLIVAIGATELSPAARTTTTTANFTTNVHVR